MGPAPNEHLHETGAPHGALSALLQELVKAPPDSVGSAWARELRPGDQVGRFRIVRELGRGGFGVVYEADDLELARRVALKALRPRRSGEELAADWIRREAEAAARLDHPAIVTLFDVGTSDGSPYLVMELLRGETLAQRLERGALPLGEALRVGLELARGLAHAHGRGLLHRDLKPANVFLCEDGRVKILDLGLAHLLGTPGAPGSGTPGYMAPEQERGEPIDARADVFAAAATLREMVTGQRGGGPAGGARLPAALARLLDRGLAADPGGRPRDGAAWLADLAAVEAAVERPRRLRRVALFVGAGLALGSVAAWLVAGQVGRVPLAGPDGRIAVAVGDFVNQTGDAELDGLSGMLVTSLEQSKLLRVLTRSRLAEALQGAGRESTTRIDETLAREVGKRLGVRALLLASIRRLGDAYAVELRAVDPERDEYLFTVKEQANGKGAVLALLDRLSERTRAALREGAAEVAAAAVPVARATSENFEAYGHYFRGKQLSDDKRGKEAIGEYRAAIALDPTFAMAYLALAQEGAWTGMPEEEERALMAKAVAQLDRVGEKERLLILAWKAHLDGQYQEAKRRYDEAVARWPDDKDLLFQAGDLRLHFNDARNPVDTAEALSLFERVLKLDPRWEYAFQHQLWCLEGLGRQEEALTRARAWAELVNDERGLYWLKQALWMSRRWDEAVEVARRRLERVPNTVARWDVAVGLLLAGRYAESESFLRALLAADLPDREKNYFRDYLACALAAQGRRAEALRELERRGASGAARGRVIHLVGDGADEAARREVVKLASTLGQTDSAPWPALAALWLGERAAAAKLAGGMLDGKGDPFEQVYRGALAWQEGRLDEAGALLRPPAVQWADTIQAPDSRPFARLVLARVELARGDRAAAVASLERLRLNPGPMSRYITWSWVAPAGQLLEARTLADLGRREEARRLVADLLARWKRADAGYKLAAEARVLAAALDAQR